MKKIVINFIARGYCDFFIHESPWCTAICKFKINCLSTTVFRSPSGLAVITYVCTCMHVSKYAYMCVYVYDTAYILISCCFGSKAACSFWQHQSLFFPMYFCYTCNMSLYIFVHFVLLFSFTFKFTDSVMQMVEYPQLCSCSGLLCLSTSLNIRNGGNRHWCCRVLPGSCWYRKRFKPYFINFCWFWTWNQKFLWLTLHRALRYKVSHQKWWERIYCTYSQYSKYKCKIWQSLSSYK